MEYFAEGLKRMLSTLADQTRRKLHVSVFDFDLTFTVPEFPLEDGYSQTVVISLGVCQSLACREMSISTSERHF